MRQVDGRLKPDMRAGLPPCGAIDCAQLGIGFRLFCKDGDEC